MIGVVNPVPIHSYGNWPEFLKLNGAGPVGRNLDFSRPGSGIHTFGGYVNGEDIRKWILHCAWAVWTEGVFMTVEDQLKSNYDKVAELWNSYKDRLDAFRGVAKNDLSSFEAAARKTSEAAHKMNKAYSDVFTQLNSAEMERAILNAERLAVALKCIAELQSHTLKFAIIDQSANPGQQL